MINDKKWTQFVHHGKTDINVRKNVLESWKRCKQLGVSHERDIVFSHIPPSDLVERQQKNTDLIHAARPVMEEMYKRLKGGGYLLLLADADGYLVDMMADHKSQTIADKAGISVGARWMEENVGSTGLSIAIRTKATIATSGNEHFCLAFRVWDCSASPIFIDGKFVGVFDVCRMGPGNDLKQLLALAVSGSQAISSNYKVNKLKVKDHVFSHIFTECSHRFNKHTGVISFDNQGIELFKNELAQDFSALLEQERSRSEVDQISILSMIDHQQSEIELSGKVFLLKREEIHNRDGRLATVFFIDDANIVSGYKREGDRDPFFDSESTNYLKTVQMARRTADSDASILIQGESGVGKDYMARFIHNQSKRRDWPYRAINCAALSRDLITTELFGYESGAFTGAKQRGSQGKIEASDKGTIFLDEIADLPLDLQATLLRTLEEKYIVRVGGITPIPVNVRFLAATNKNLKELVAKGEFREDLYYRLNVFSLKIPPLRERKEDFDLILHTMLQEACERAQRKSINVTPEAIGQLKQHSWPGNLRELRNVIERIVFLHDEETFTKFHVPEFLELAPSNEDINEEERIAFVLKKTNGNRTKAARELGITRSAFYRKMQKYNIE